jgi:hypothetical protein
LRLLLGIPSVKALAHQELTRGNPNELLRLAISIGNIQAATLLLNIEAVRVLAQQHNFYQLEARNGVDIRQLAQDRESSMTALTEGEKKRFDFAIEKYQPMIKKMGIDSIINKLRSHLIIIYEQQPACLVIGDKQTNLPALAIRDFFRNAGLNKEDTKKVFEAYFTHPAHTAFRFLSKPNPFIHPKANYVNRSPDGKEGWSTFEEYLPLIAMFYLAAIDEQVSASDGHTLESRLNHFIQELALIGRAHNWDRTRVRNEKEEEYDDLDFDRPSCYSGVKRRLFQSVVGHPLFDILDEDKIKAEINQLAFTHFKSILTDDNKHQFKKIIDDHYALNDTGNVDDTQVEKLAYLDIPQEKYEEFIKYLTQKYGTQFSDNPALVFQVKNALCVTPGDVGPDNRYHVLKLMTSTNFYKYLEDYCENASNNGEAKASNTGLFSQSNAMEVETPSQAQRQKKSREQTDTSDEDDNPSKKPRTGGY